MKPILFKMKTQIASLIFLTIFSTVSCQNKKTETASTTKTTTTQKNPFLMDRAYYLYGDLNISLMNDAARLLFNYTDFNCFSIVVPDTVIESMNN